MHRFATSFGCVLGLLALSGGQELAAQSNAWSDAVQERTKALVSTQWDLSPEVIELEWGPASNQGTGALEDVQLLGSGRGGHWVARIVFAGQGPVSVRVRAGFRTVRGLSATRLARGQVLTDSDIEWAEWTVWGEPSANAQALVEGGWVVQRAIRAGVPLESPAVRPPLAVSSGDPVEAWWRQGAVGIRVVATASGSGAVGDRVYVRTEDGARLEGVVVAPGVVNIIQGLIDESPEVRK